jgi:exopolyphosphatase/guanosine-5'-triphosphate,3'-diphosphate pyrophosphatase
MSHVDAPGFSQSQRRRLAALVLAQRGGLRQVEESLAQDEVAWQVLCLRIAIIVCHARAGVDPDELALRRSGGVATLGVPAEWTQKRPRTLHLLNEEIEAWERGGPFRLEIGG